MITNGLPVPHCQPRVGIRAMFEGLAALGLEIHVWSGGGAAYARSVTEHCELGDLVTAWHSKAEYPMNSYSASQALGFVPVLQVDDDPHEAVNDWNFHLMPPCPEWGYPPSTRTTDRDWERYVGAFKSYLDEAERGW